MADADSADQWGDLVTTSELLNILVHRGIQIAADDDRLRYFPRSAVTPALLDGLKAHKAELPAILRVRATLPDVVQEEAQDDAELLWRVSRLSAEGQELWRRRCIERIAAGEPIGGVGWRSLVDVRRVRKGTPDEVSPETEVDRPTPTE